MALAWKLSAIILLWSMAVQADVAHLGYSRYRSQRLRLQRLEAEPTPYPAAGFRPNREFSLPREQPLFPLANQHSDRPFGNGDFNNLGETQRPQLTYGSPQPEPRFRPQNRPQKFNNDDEAREQIFVVQYQQRQQPAQSNNFNFQRPQQTGNGKNNDFNNFAPTQQLEFEEQAKFNNQQNGFNNLAEAQQPDNLYGAPQLVEQTKFNNQQNGFNNLAEAQQPDNLYGAPQIQEQEAQSARLTQHLVARLQQAQQQQQQQKSQRYRKAQSQILPSQQQQVLNAPQSLYTAPSQQSQFQQSQLQAQSQILPSQQQQQVLNAPQTLYTAPSQQSQFQQSQLQAESQTNRVIARKPARLTDNREETDLEGDNKTAESGEIETTTKTENKTAVKPSVVSTNAATPVVANTGVVSYYPAGAVSFVQPFNAAYIASANYQALQPITAAYTVGTPYLPQQYTLTAAPAAPLGQLQAW